MALPPRDDPKAGKRTFDASWDRLVRRADPDRQKALLNELELVMSNGREFYANRGRRGGYDGSDDYLIDEYFTALCADDGVALQISGQDAADLLIDDHFDPIGTDAGDTLAQ